MGKISIVPLWGVVGDLTAEITENAEILFGVLIQLPGGRLESSPARKI
jgi:hypothetical protein